MSKKRTKGLKYTVVGFTPKQLYILANSNSERDFISMVTEQLD